MSSHRMFFMIPALIILALNFTGAAAQSNILWLQDFTGDMVIGNDTYRYEFATVDGNDCKVEFRESVTDKKGSTESRSWIFYLSDIDPEGINFRTRGKYVETTLETRNSQKFITCYEDGTLDEYTDEVSLRMTEVDVTRKLIDLLKSHIGSCTETETSWDDRDAAFGWLTQNIGKAVDDDVQWEQQFSQGDKPYLARLSSKSTDSKGNEEAFEYLFDLSDINPASVKLEVSGKSLAVAVPVRDGKDYIEMNGPGGREYTDELMIYADDIEMARNTVNAMYYVTAGTVPERQAWDSYLGALGFVKENLGEVRSGDDLFHTGLEYTDNPAGIVKLTVAETEDEGETEKVVYSFYLADMVPQPVLEVSRNMITIEMETMEDRDYIMKTTGGSVTGYDSDMEFPAAGIDVARDIVRALEVAIANSLEDIREFTSVEEVNSWMDENLVTLFSEDEQYEQKLTVNRELQNQIVYERKVTEEGEGVTETKYVLYPEDISLDELKIGVKWGKLNVAIETAKDDYIRNFKNGVLQDYTDDVEVYFSDPLVAKNFVAAVRYLKEHTAATESPEMSGEEAFSFLAGNIPHVEVPGEVHEQKLEMADGEPCKLRFTRVEKEDDGDSDEFVFEFMPQDIDSGKSKLSAEGELLEITLVTVGNQKLIKPFENGEEENFDDDFTIYADDVLLAKKLMAAFGALSNACQ